MASNIYDLMRLSEGAVGFSSNTNTDYFPSMSLEECANQLPVVVNQDMVSDYEFSASYNESVTNAIIESAVSGTEADLDYIVEANGKSLKERLREWFEKMKKWVESIINKITVTFNTLFRSGAKLADMYKDKIDPAKCIDCGSCAGGCPVGTIAQG